MHYYNIVLYFSILGIILNINSMCYIIDLYDFNEKNEPIHFSSYYGIVLILV